MLDNCPYCNGKRINKNGNKYGRQRYICRDCGKSFSDGDNRIKRDIIQKELAILLYSSNVSFKSIQKIINKVYDTNVSFSLIIKWINSTAKLLEFRNRLEKEKVNKEIKENNNIENNINNKTIINGNSNSTNNKKQTINILEMDELWSYYTTKDKETNKTIKKNSKFGLLLTETEIKLLHLM